jgi:hypothetical protein
MGIAWWCGMSYGIVTELRLQTFPLPPELIKFELNWNEYDATEQFVTETHPTLQILQAWEKVVQAKNTPQLIGTNLKIMARPAIENFDYTTICHNCCMYGYWEGTEEDLNNFGKTHFGKEPVIDSEDGANAREHYKIGKLMDKWDRVSFAEIKGRLTGKSLPVDLHDPAPHKVTSRLVNKEGLSKEGYQQLLLSLTSPLVAEENYHLGVFSFILVHAISGNYYHENRQNNNSAFPYKDKPYAIQYQTWWSTDEKHREYDGHYQESPVYENINRAMDWIDAARGCNIPNTSGAFISFKDNSVPTKVYFDKSYERLKAIKKEHVKDPNNHLRTRKTII